MVLSINYPVIITFPKDVYICVCTEVFIWYLFMDIANIGLYL